MSKPTRASIIIRESRKRAGLTQQELADKLGITTGAVSNYENGVSFPKAEIAFGLCDQTKIPEKPGAKPLFGDFTLELLIRFERTTCSLRAIKGTFNVLCRVVSLSNKLRDAIILFVRCCIVQSR